MDAPAPATKAIPFDHEKLDRLLGEAGIDALLVTSNLNVQFLLGGYRFFFFDYMDAMGVSRYLPVLFYQRGKPENSAYIGYRLEMHEKELDRFWTPVVQTASSTSADAMGLAVDHIKKLGNGVRTIGVEMPFLPADAQAVVKTKAELDLLRTSSERVVESMMATFRQLKPGMTKREMVDTLKREEVNRGLTFEYCLNTAGSSLNRAPSDQKLKKGDIISLDSGGNYHGYIGDLCRMAILQDKPDAELEDLLGIVDEIQQKARKPIKPGARGGEIAE